MNKTLSVTTITTILMIGFFSYPAFAFFGEIAIIVHGVRYVDKQLNTQTNQTSSSNSSQSEYNRGLEDGFNKAKYQNSDDSVDYYNGYYLGVKRDSQGWKTPFTE